MKRVTVLLLACFLITSAAFAANNKIQHDRIMPFADVASTPVPQVDLSQIQKVSQSPGVSIVGDPSVIYYDWQSNGGDEKHLVIMPDGQGHAAFMGDDDDSGAGGGSGRGTYYSYSSDFGETWTYIGRVEPRRSGYHSMDVTSDGRAVVSSHTTPAGSIIGPSIFIDALAGFGIFTEFSHPRTAIEWTWPQVVVPTDDYVFFTAYSDGDEEPLLWSSVDPNTGAFAADNVLFPGIDNEIRACTVRSAGGKVTTLLIQGLDMAKLGQWGENNIIAMTSTDMGRTFGDPYMITDLPADTTLETIPSLWLGISACYVGEELHVVWTQVEDTSPAEDGISYFFDTITLMHWAESVNGGEPTVAVRWDSLHFAGDLGSGTDVLAGNHIRIDWPKIGADENGTLIMSFTAFVGDSTMLDPVTDTAFGEIFAVASADNGLQWGEPTNLTNSVDMDDRYSYISAWNEAGKFTIMYQSDTIAGTTIQDAAPVGNPDYLVLKSDIPSTEPYTAPSSVEQISSVPASYNLEQNYPNPFNPSTNIRFSLEKNNMVKLTVFNMLGENVATLVDGYRNAGTHEASWNASNMPTGLYFYRLEVGNTVLTRKMTLLK